MLTTRRALMALGIMMLGVASATAPALAGNEPVPYTQEAFDAAQKAGKPILIDTFATWCDVCARQKPIIDKLLQAQKFKDLVTFRVDFDKQKDIMRKLNARVQSTLIVFHGAKEVGRSVGETQAEWIEDLLDKSNEKGES